MTRNVRSTANGVWRTKIHDTTRIEQKGEEKADRRRHHDGRSVFTSPVQTMELMPALAIAATDQPADQCMRLTGRNPEDPGDDVPDDSAHQRRENDLRVDDGRRR